MPVLSNAKHEAVAQLAAQGIDGTHAVMTVYPNSSEAAAAVSASRLLKSPKVQARVQELSGKAAERAVVTAQMILERAWEIAQTDAKDRAQHLAIAAKAFPEFRDGVIVDNSQHIHLPEGLSTDELRKLASDR